MAAVICPKVHQCRKKHFYNYEVIKKQLKIASDKYTGNLWRWTKPTQTNWQEVITITFDVFNQYWLSGLTISMWSIAPPCALQKYEAQFLMYFALVSINGKSICVTSSIQHWARSTCRQMQLYLEWQVKLTLAQRQVSTKWPDFSIISDYFSQNA